MKKGGIATSLLSIYLFFSFLVPVSASVPVPRPNTEKDAEIVTARGDSWVKFITQEKLISAAAEQVLTSGDLVKTGSFGKMDILFIDGTQIKVHNRTTLLIKEVRKPNAGKETILGLPAGEIWSRARHAAGGLKIETPSATAGIRGTDWDIAVDEKGTSYLTVLRGYIDLYNDFGWVLVKAGEQATAEIGKPPVKMFLIRPKDRVQWISTYPMDLTRIIHFYSRLRSESERQLTAARDKVRQDASDLQAKLLLAGLLFDVREYAESLGLFDEILKKDPSNSRALVFKGLILLRNGDHEGASGCFEGALKSAEGHARTEALLGLVGVYVQRNEMEKAQHLLEDLSKAGPSPSVALALATFNAYQGDFRKAIAVCDEFGRKYPDDERFLVFAADFLIALDERAKSKDALDKAVAITPASSITYAAIGKYYYLQGEGRAAESAYRKSISLDPYNADALSELGRLLMEKGHYEESEKVMSKSVMADSRGHSYWARRGMLMNWIEDIRSARKDFRQAVDLNPADYQSFDGLGFLALKEGRTDEAIADFLKASTLEPGYAEPHIFLAIAYYQQEAVYKALEELKLAETLDPKDPVPYMVAYIIHQDTYRPFDSITDATKAIELLPNLKSVNPIETDQKGFSNLGSSLLGLGMTEWASSYAEESFNSFDASGYFFVSKKFDTNPFVFFSENVQGFLVEPMSVGYYPRYQEIVAKPHHFLTLNATLGDEDGGFSRHTDITLQGYVRNPIEMKYLLDWENHDDKGFRENGFDRGDFLTYAFSARPDYKNGLFIFGGLNMKRYGDPGPDDSIAPPNNTNSTSDFMFDFGYNRRLGPKNNLFFNFHYSRTKSDFRNPDPFGTGLTNSEITFISSFGPEGAKGYFDQGLYDVTDLVNGMMGTSYPRIYGTDASGILQVLGLQPLNDAFPSNIDLDDTKSSTVFRKGLNYQFKHLFQLGDDHQVSYGIEYSPITFRINAIYNTSMVGPAILIDDTMPFLLGQGGSASVLPDLRFAETTYELNQDSKAINAYANDRWRVSNDLLIDMGLYYETFSNEHNNFRDIYPRVGFEWKLAGRHILRAAYQKRTLESSDVTLAPVTTAGLSFQWIQLVPGARVTDYQAAIDSRWTDRLFTTFTLERRDFTTPDTEFAIFTKENRANIFSVAVNAILTKRLGVFARYQHTDSENLDDVHKGKATPLVPAHNAEAGLVLVLPSYIKALLSTNYAARIYGDDDNNYKMPDYWTTDLSATWEPMRKHVMVKLNINNIFDNRYETVIHYPAAGRSFFLTGEYRF
ncbi:MAG: TonB-dependent receptor domain-containing protein [Acidobacteriota bacterium]